MTESVVKFFDNESPPSQERAVEVSVVLPSVNEAQTIGVCISKVKKVFENYGIIGEVIVSDNSQDETPDIARSLGAKVVTPDRMGYGYAYRYAFKHASGNYIVMGDADDTYDFAEMPMLLEPLKKDEADLVVGNRFSGKMEKGAMPWHHKYVGNPVLTRFLNIFFKSGVSDAHSGFRAVTKEALEKLNLEADGMELASEMLMEAAENGLRIKEVPISYHKRRNSNSKLSSFSDGERHLKFMLIHAPNYLFIYPGFFLLLTGLFLMGSAFLNINIGYAPEIHSVIAGSMLTISGYQIVFFGLFARIYRGEKVPRFLTLERGAAIGASLFIIGSVYVSILLMDWMKTGFTGLPPVKLDMLGFTFIILGIQTFFSSFMLSTLAERKKGLS